MSDETFAISEGRDDRVFKEAHGPPPQRARVPVDSTDDGPLETIEIEGDPRDTLEQGDPEPAREV